MFDKQVIQMIAEGIRDTLYMTLFSTIIGYVIGLSEPDHLPDRRFYL